MKLFFVFLLILNLLFAGWQYLQPMKYKPLVKPLSVDLEQLELLAEVKENPPVIKSETTELIIETQEIIDTSVPVDDDLCYTLGPFKDEETLQQVQGALSEKVLDVAVRKREERRQHRYWVYLPAFESRAKAIEVSKKLAQKNIKDYYIVRSGNLDKGISLGHFKEKSYADRRVKNLKKQGFDANIEVIYRNFNIFWLDYRLADKQNESTDYINEFMLGDVTILDRDCN